MKKMILFCALALSGVGVFADVVPTAANRNFVCNARYRRVFVNAEGEVLLVVVRYGTGANCGEALAQAQAQANAVTPMYLDYFNNN